MKRIFLFAILIFVGGSPLSSFGRAHMGFRCRSVLGYEFSGRIAGSRLQSIVLKSDERTLFTAASSLEAKVLKDSEQIEWAVRAVTRPRQLFFYLPMNLEAGLFPGELVAVLDSACAKISLDCWREP